MLSTFWIVFISVLAIGCIGSIFTKDSDYFEMAWLLVILMGIAKFILS